MAKQPPMDFLEKFILSMLEKNGLANLSETNKAIYLPQLMFEAQQRIGIALAAKLDQANAEKFVQMLDRVEKYQPEDWQKFWQSAVPEYESVINETLQKFGVECQQILAGK